MRSTDGADVDDGTTWALADATLTGAAAADAAGDVIWVSQVHAESTAAAIIFNWAGTAAAPTRVICGNDAAEPPTALATTATVTTTGNSNIDCFSGADFLYVYGITFNSGSAASGTASINIAGATADQTYDSCNFNLATTGASSIISIAGNTNRTVLKNCGFQFSATGQQLSFGGGCIIQGCSILADAAITVLLAVAQNASNILFEGCDFSNGAAAMNLAATTVSGERALFRNCKLPASWSGSVNSATPGVASVYELCNSDSADTNYRYQKKTQFGTIDSETTIVANLGASDGTTKLSHKMVTNANAEWNHQTLDGPEIVQWNETLSSITATIEIIHSGGGSGTAGRFTDKEIWMEVQYLGTSGRPLSLFIDDAAADYITAAADQADSTVTWDSSPATPVKQKLSVTFTPAEKGFIHAVVKMAGASDTCYVDPKITIT